MRLNALIILMVLIAASTAGAGYWIGGNGEMAIPDTYPGIGDFTYCIWLQRIPGEGNWEAYFSGPESGGVPTISLVWYSSSGYFQATINNGSSFYTQINSSTLPADHNRHLITLTCDRDSAAGLNLYYDNQATPIATGNPLSNLATNFNYALGDIYAPDPCVFYFDQIRFHKGTALSAAQIADIYKNGVGEKVNESSFAAISDGWYSEFDVNVAGSFLGRKCALGVWSDSNATVNTGFAWDSGGVPFVNLKAINNQYSIRRHGQ